MGHHEGRTVCLLDDLGHGIGLARAGYAEQYLVLLAVEYPARQRLDRVALVTFRRVVADETEVHNVGIGFGCWPQNWRDTHVSLTGNNFAQRQFSYYIGRVCIVDFGPSRGWDPRLARAARSGHLFV